MPDKRTSKITKSVEVLINTGHWTNIRIGNTYEETIEWETKEERVQKEDSIHQLLLENLRRDLDRALKFTGRKEESTVNFDVTSPKTSAAQMGLTDLGEGEPLG